MALNTENAGALVSGAPGSNTTVKVKLIERTSVDGVMFDVGEVVEARRDDAVWLVQTKKAEYV